MAKKVRRVKKKRKRKAESASPELETAESATADKVDGTHDSTTDQFQLEYAYVVKDLRRVLILAAIMFALLIALNLLLQ